MIIMNMSARFIRFFPCIFYLMALSGLSNRIYSSLLSFSKNESPKNGTVFSDCWIVWMRIKGFECMWQWESDHWMKTKWDVVWEVECQISNNRSLAWSFNKEYNSITLLDDKPGEIPSSTFFFGLVVFCLIIH